LCDIFESDKDILFSISITKQCKFCKTMCNFINFDTKIEVSKHVLNKTVLEIIPIKSLSIAYIETLKTDINRFIYNCEGILGLWFGISELKAGNSLIYLPQIYRIAINLCAQISQFLISI
jgi:hypothetical protein